MSMSISAPESKMEHVAAGCEERKNVMEKLIEGSCSKNQSDFDNCVVMNMFKQLGSMDDLLLLKRLTKQYYDVFAPAFFNALGLTLEMMYFGSDDPNQYYFNRCSIKVDGPIPKVITHEDWTSKNGRMVRNLKLPSKICYQNQKLDQIVLGDEFEKENWTGTIISMFRKILPFGYNQMKYIAGRSSVTALELLSRISPFITKLNLSLSSHKRVPGDEDHVTILSEFLQQFTSLKNLELFCVKRFDWEEDDVMPLDQLKRFIQNVKPAIQIQLRIAGFDLFQLIRAFGAPIPNLSIIWLYEQRPFPRLSPNLDLEFTKTKQFLIAPSCLQASTIDELETITHCIQHQYQGRLTEIGLQIRRNGFNAQDVYSVKSLLKEMNPILYKLVLSDAEWLEPPADGKNFDLLNKNPGEEYNWPNLKQLSICGYNRPLEVLKHCPALVYLSLKVDLGSCIFHNPEKSTEGAVNEYFGNLPQLKSLGIYLELDTVAYFQSQPILDNLRKMYPKADIRLTSF